MSKKVISVIQLASLWDKPRQFQAEEQKVRALQTQHHHHHLGLQGYGTEEGGG